MKLNPIKKILFIFACTLLICFYKNASAQKIEYSSENVFIEYPDHLQLVANIAGNHHLVKFVEKEYPEIFVFNKDLTLQAKISIPFRFPERAEMRVIPLNNFYFIYIHPLFTQQYFLWRVDGNGNFIDLTSAFQKLLQSQSHNIKLGFQLIPNQDQLCMVYHTDLTNIQKTTVVIVQTDSLLNRVFEHKVLYDFKRDEERLLQEVLMFGRYLFVLKTARSGTSLELMKVNVATGYTIRNTFFSSGYFYSQAAINYNGKDSTVTVSSLLTEPRTSSKPKYFVFVSRMNKILIEEVPLGILKSQFLKNTATNFFLVDKSKWVRIGAETVRTYYTVQQNTQSLYQDLTMSSQDQNLIEDSRVLERTFARSNGYLGDPPMAIRFSLLDKNFKILNDSLVSNSKSSFTIQAGNFARFHVRDKEYMLVGQRFFRKSYGLLMVNSDNEHLVHTNVRVYDRNNYLLSKASITPQGIIIPYIHSREAGLVRITIE